MSKLRKIIKGLLTYLCTKICLRNVKSHGKDIHVNFPSQFTSKTTMGNNCHFNGMTITGSGNVTIGDNFHSGKRVYIMTSYHNYDKGKALPYDDTWITRDVTIKDNVWLGQDVTILAGVTIGEGAVIQAGSVVCSDIPPLAIAGGHPAKAFKYRDEEHYFSLKNGPFF